MRVQTEKQLNFNKHSIHVYESAVRHFWEWINLLQVWIENVDYYTFYFSIAKSEIKFGKDTGKVIRFS